MTAPKLIHPAKYTPAVLACIADLIGCAYRPLLDVFAGVGGIHALPFHTVGVEIEEPWAAAHPMTICADSRHLPFPNRSFRSAATSCAYGNRFADHHKAMDGSSRRSYTHDLRRQTGEPDRDLVAGNSGRMPFGPEYQDLHAEVWADLARVLEPGAPFALNTSDFYKRRKGVDELIRVTDWHTGCLTRLGYTLLEEVHIDTPRLRHGENTKRAAYESVQLYQAPR